jgi:predicted SnoaL-like aldol condensation-catalyzing enzyme
MNKTIEEANKRLVLDAFDTLFNTRDYEAAERFWSPNYIQHSAHIPPGREGLFNLIRSVPAELRYEPGLILADKEFVMVHGRFSGTGRPRNWIAADIVRIADGVLVEPGTCCRTRRGRTSRRAGDPCSATRRMGGAGANRDFGVGRCVKTRRHPQNAPWRQPGQHVDPRGIDYRLRGSDDGGVQ